jgi:hypothetical protein
MPTLWRDHTGNRLGVVIKRAERMQPIVGFGIDRVAAAAEETGGSHGGPLLRMENLDTDLPLPPEALEVTRIKLDDPKSNSWLPVSCRGVLRACTRALPPPWLRAGMAEAHRRTDRSGSAESVGEGVARSAPSPRPGPVQGALEVVAGPLGQPHTTPGVSYRGMRTVAFDGCMRMTS